MLKEKEVHKPPPMWHLQGYTWVNEHELVEWYTDMGKLYAKRVYEDRFSWFSKWFKRDYELKLEQSLTRNRMMCTEWTR